MAGFDGSGTFVRTYNWVTDKSNSVKITASRQDTEDDGFATGLSTAICKDGQTTTTAAIPFAVGIKVSDGSFGTPAINFVSDLDSGFYRIGANNVGLSLGGAKVWDYGTATASAPGSMVLGGSLAVTGTAAITGPLAVTGQITGNGAIPVGSVHTFFKDPGTVGSGGVGTGWQFLEADGGTWNVSDFPALGAIYRASAGATTFTVDDMKTLGLFIRSRTNATTVGTRQTTSQNLSHTHADNFAIGTTGSSHSHTITDPGHVHTARVNNSASGTTHPQSNYPGFVSSSGNYATTADALFNTDASTGFIVNNTTGITATDAGGTHTHNITGSVTAAGSSEARPVNISAIICIKT